MPDDRLIHPAFGQSEKINRLTAFERDVWLVYKLAADDFGVMRCAAPPLQRIARWLEDQPTKRLLKALDVIREVGLIQYFDHQGQTYVFDPVWQTWQKVTYPRATKQPAPPSDLVDINTRWLMEHHPEGGRLPSWQHPSLLPEKSGKKPRNAPELVRESFSTRARSNTLPNSNTSTNTGERDELGERAGRFVNEVYPALYAKYRRGARYVSKPALDFQEAMELCRVWDDARLEKIAIVFLTTDHQFAESGSRTMAQLRALASWCDGKIAEAGIA